MIKEKRFELILNSLKKEGIVTYENLANLLQVSEDTVRRDIEALYQHGLLSKVRGGAIPRAKNPLSFQDRSAYHPDGKEIIALKAQQLIQNGQTLFMDGGTTICNLGAYLPADCQLRIVTNNCALIPILSNYKKVEIIMLGGFYNRDTMTNVGVITCKEVSNYVADLYFMGTCAIHNKFGITAALNDDGEVKRAMLASSIQTIALANGEKLNSLEHFKICAITEIHGLITDLSTDDHRLDTCRNLGIKLI